MSNTKLFYSYKDTKNTGKVTTSALSSYSDSIIFDEDNRRLWHNGKQYGNTYWGTKHGETFNDLDNNYAYDYAHAEGSNSYAAGKASHVEGISNSAYGVGAHAEGDSNIANGDYSHVEGINNSTNGKASHAEGYHNVAYGDYSHAEGNNTIAKGRYSNSQGDNTTSEGYGSHAEGFLTYASYNYSHVEGSNTTSYGIGSHAEGWLTSTKAAYSHSEGKLSYSIGSYSHSEGSMSITYGDGSHTEGESTISYGYCSHAEGYKSISYGNNSHAEGGVTYAYGYGSHAEGFGSNAIGDYSHAEGAYSYAAGKCSHTQGLGTVAYNAYEVAFGRYNLSNSGDNPTIYSIGNGQTNSRRSNIIDFRENGDMHKNGNSYFHDNIYGPVSYTYVSSLGDTATLDIILSSLLTQPEYTRPKITAQYKLSTESNYSLSTSNSSYCEKTVELGTFFIPEFQVVWPTRTSSNANGTRAENIEGDPSKKPNYLLGYSYGVVPKGYEYPDGSLATNNGISIKYNNGGALGVENTDPNACNNAYYAYGLYTTYSGTTSPCYILGETTYTLFSNLQVSYLPFSYMYFQQLYDKGVYVRALGLPPKEWLDDGVTKLGGFKAHGRLKYFWGFSGDSKNPGKNHPQNRKDLIGQKWDWLPQSNTSTIVNINTGGVGTPNASKYCLWIAYPDSTDDSTNTINGKHYKLVTNQNNFKIEVLQQDGMNYDLVSPDQPLKSSFLTISLGNPKYTTRYKIAYIDLLNPIGNINNVLKFSIAPISNDKPALI